MNEPFDETREQLDGGLTRRRPRPGEADFGSLSHAWIYEFVFRGSMSVDDVVLESQGSTGYIRSEFANAMRRAADRLEHGA